MTNSELKRNLQTCGMKTFVLYHGAIKLHAMCKNKKSLNDAVDLITKTSDKVRDGAEISVKAGAKIINEGRESDALDLVIASKSKKVTGFIKQLAWITKKAEKNEK